MRWEDKAFPSTPSHGSGGHSGRGRLPLAQGEMPGRRTSSSTARRSRQTLLDTEHGVEEDSGGLGEEKLSKSSDMLPETWRLKIAALPALKARSPNWVLWAKITDSFFWRVPGRVCSLLCPVASTPWLEAASLHNSAAKVTSPALLHPNTFFNSTNHVFSLSFSDPFCLQHVTNCKGSSDLLIQGYKVFNTEDN